MMVADRQQKRTYENASLISLRSRVIQCGIAGEEGIIYYWTLKITKKHLLTWSNHIKIAPCSQCSHMLGMEETLCKLSQF